MEVKIGGHLYINNSKIYTQYRNLFFKISAINTIFMYKMFIKH